MPRSKRRRGESLMKQGRKNDTTTIAVIGSLILAIILVAGTMWMGSRARRDTEEAVRSVSLLYLDELAGRREQVVEDNLREKIQTIRVAVDLLTAEDLTDKAHLESYQTRMKRLYHLDKFAFVDTDGLIYTSTGTQSNIDEYSFDFRALSEPEISIFLRTVRISALLSQYRSVSLSRGKRCLSALWPSICRKCSPVSL